MFDKPKGFKLFLKMFPMSSMKHFHTLVIIIIILNKIIIDCFESFYSFIVPHENKTKPILYGILGIIMSKLFALARNNPNISDFLLI